ncbi:MAG: hypothetical protein ACRC76_11400, partial [Proteocatella sp.]
TQIKLNKLELPIEKGDKVGVLEVYAKDKLIMKRDLFADNNVKKSIILSIGQKIKSGFISIFQ